MTGGIMCCELASRSHLSCRYSRKKVRPPASIIWAEFPLSQEAFGQGSHSHTASVSAQR